MYCVSCEVQTEFICYVEESRPPLWSSGQSSWLYNGDILCFLWGTNWIYVCYIEDVEESRPPRQAVVARWVQFARGLRPWNFCVSYVKREWNPKCCDKPVYKDDRGEALLLTAPLVLLMLMGKGKFLLNIQLGRPGEQNTICYKAQSQHLQQVTAGSRWSGNFLDSSLH
jgi:hypothetical protein